MFPVRLSICRLSIALVVQNGETKWDVIWQGHTCGCKFITVC